MNETPPIKSLDGATFVDYELGFNDLIKDFKQEGAHGVVVKNRSRTSFEPIEDAELVKKLDPFKVFTPEQMLNLSLREHLQSINEYVPSQQLNRAARRRQGVLDRKPSKSRKPRPIDLR